MRKDAELSEDGRYRYKLERVWDDAEPLALFVMLNPSTADAEVDDPTIRRCIGFARRWGYGGVLVGNLYAYRATRPSELDDADDPIGRRNEEALYELVRRAGLIVAAWGAQPARGGYVWREGSIANGPLYERVVWALGLTKAGHPKHPLYVPGDAELVRWPAGELEVSYRSGGQNA